MRSLPDARRVGEARLASGWAASHPLGARTIVVTGARCGQGTTTVAATPGPLAAEVGPTTLVPSEVNAAGTVLGVSRGGNDACPVTAGLVLAAEIGDPAVADSDSA